MSQSRSQGSHLCLRALGTRLLFSDTKLPLPPVTSLLPGCPLAGLAEACFWTTVVYCLYKAHVNKPSFNLQLKSVNIDNRVEGFSTLPWASTY